LDGDDGGRGGGEALAVSLFPNVTVGSIRQKRIWLCILLTPGNFQEFIIFFKEKKKRERERKRYMCLLKAKTIINFFNII
jgi:hypothetical protein